MVKIDFTKRHWPKLLLAVTVGVMVTTIVHSNKQGKLEANLIQCADVHQSAKIANLNYLLGKDKEHSLIYRPIFDENLTVYEKVVDQIYSQDYQPHPIIREAQTSIIATDAYLECLQEFLPIPEDEDVVQN